MSCDPGVGQRRNEFVRFYQCLFQPIFTDSKRAYHRNDESCRRGKKLLFFFFATFHRNSNLCAAIQIYVNCGLKCIRISKMMAFVLRIVGVLERINAAITVNMLRTVLNLGISDCFPYGENSRRRSINL